MNICPKSENRKIPEFQRVEKVVFANRHPDFAQDYILISLLLWEKGDHFVYKMVDEEQNFIQKQTYPQGFGCACLAATPLPSPPGRAFLCNVLSLYFLDIFVFNLIFLYI